jgi:diguanylate cyclase (GGDEF)-like protein/PAS domain S-box-containing protein
MAHDTSPHRSLDPAPRSLAPTVALAIGAVLALIALDVVHRLAELAGGGIGLGVRWAGWSAIAAVVVLLLARHRPRRDQREGTITKMAERVFENAVEGIVITDRDGHILMVNPAFTSITGYSAEEAIGETPRILKSDRHGTEFYEEMWSQLLRKGQWSGEIFNRQKSGKAYPEWLNISAITDDEDRVTHYVAVFHDMSEFKRREEHMRFLAHHDALTGAANRVLFEDRLQHCLAQARRKGTTVGLVFIDLDDFKSINDRHGHLAGDLVLRETVNRLRGVVRETDTIARLGGDEFAVIVPMEEDPSGLDRINAAIRTAVNRPIDDLGATVTVSCSVGMALYPKDGSLPEELLAAADRAMYEEKSRDPEESATA